MRLADKRELDLIGLEDLFQCLDGREVTTGVIAHPNLYAGQVARLLNRRLRRDDNGRWGHGVRVSPHAAVARGRSHVDRPMARATDVGDTTFLHIFEGPAFYFRRGGLGGLDERVSGRLRRV